MAAQTLFRFGSSMYFVVVLVFVIAIETGDGDDSGKKVEKKSVKIVDAPVVSRAYYSTWNSKKLIARASPASVRGPVGVMFLNGTCLSMTEGDYKYEVCPFQNVTQHEQSSRWNAYKGVLGVYQGWRVVNGSLYSMVMLHGDACGTSGTFRQTEVVFRCAAQQKLAGASEPSTCHYQLIFQTPLACNSTLMAVYYLLNSSQQLDWRRVQELYFHSEITLKGLTKRMDEIYLEAGLTPVTNNTLEPASAKKDDSSHNTEHSSSSKFSLLSSCEKAHDDLVEKVKKLEAELASFRLNRTLNVTGAGHLTPGGNVTGASNSTKAGRGTPTAAAASTAHTEQGAGETHSTRADTHADSGLVKESVAGPVRAHAQSQVLGKGRVDGQENGNGLTAHAAASPGKQHRETPDGEQDVAEANGNARRVTRTTLIDHDQRETHLKASDEAKQDTRTGKRPRGSDPAAGSRQAAQPHQQL